MHSIITVVKYIIKFNTWLYCYSQ